MACFVLTLPPPPLPVHPKVEQINAVFTAATRQKAWDHFSKAQRKNIDIWRKQCEVGIPFTVFSSHPSPLSSLLSFLSPHEKAERQSFWISCIQCSCCCFSECCTLADRQTDRQTSASDSLSLYTFLFSSQPQCNTKIWRLLESVRCCYGNSDLLGEVSDQLFIQSQI